MARRFRSDWWPCSDCIAVDASIIKADASRQRGVPGDEPVNWSDPSLSTRAVRENLEALDEEALPGTFQQGISTATISF